MEYKFIDLFVGGKFYNLFATYQSLISEVVGIKQSKKNN